MPSVYCTDPDLVFVLRTVAPGWAVVTSLGGSPPCAFGYGPGADEAAELLLAGKVRGAVLLRPSAVPAAGTFNLGGAPALIITGAEDEGQKLAEVLSQAGARVELAVQNCGPDLTPQDFSLAKQWFAAQTTSL